VKALARGLVALGLTSIAVALTYTALVLWGEHAALVTALAFGAGALIPTHWSRP